MDCILSGVIPIPVVESSSHLSSVVACCVLQPASPHCQHNHFQNSQCYCSESQSFPSLPLGSGCKDHWSWNKYDKSQAVYLCGFHPRIVHFHPNFSYGTAGVRGTRILNGGRFYWEITISKRNERFFIYDLLQKYFMFGMLISFIHYFNFLLYKYKY
jgi:hypothetical protein